MSDYSGLDELVQQMHFNAIECHAADQGYSKHFILDCYAMWGFFPTYTRPDPKTGQGGGESLDPNYSSVTSTFDAIRSAITEEVEIWRDLPDGANCPEIAARAQNTAKILGTSAADSFDIKTANDNVKDALSAMSGMFKARMMDKYYTQLANVTHGLGDGCKLLEANFVGQANLWPAARQDVMRLCTEASAAWRAKADSVAAANNEAVLKVIAAVATTAGAIVSTVASGGAAAVPAIAAIGSTANIALAAISASVAISGSSSTEIFSSLSSGLKKLNETIKAQEDALSVMQSDTYRAMQSYVNAGSFDLDAFPLGDYPTDPGKMSMEEDDAETVTLNMTRIQGYLESAVRSLGAAPSENPTPRNASVGRGLNGTYPASATLFETISSRLASTSAEYGRGHDLFKATRDMYFATDAASKAQVQRLLADEALKGDENG